MRTSTQRTSMLRGKTFLSSSGSLPFVKVTMPLGKGLFFANDDAQGLAAALSDLALAVSAVLVSSDYIAQDSFVC